MIKIVTIGRRYLKDDVWHDDRGPIPDTPADWVPPMTDEEIAIAALSDPDAQPLMAERLARMRPRPRVFVIRRAFKLTQKQFAEAFCIPVGTLRDWEQGRAEPDQAARAYLRVIAAEPDMVRKALERVPA